MSEATNLPGFLTQYGISPAQEPADYQEIILTNTDTTSHSPGPSFTIRDWEMLQAVLSSGAAHQLTDHQCSNSELGKKLGMTNGAVSARIKRLAQMGVVQVVHFNATDTGKNNRRFIHVLKQPPKPWSPE